MRAWVALVAVTVAMLVAGCSTPPPRGEAMGASAVDGLDDTTSGQAPFPEPSGNSTSTLDGKTGWNRSVLLADTAIQLSVPEGDSFGYILHQFTANDSFDFFGSKYFGISLDLGALAEGAYVEMSAHVIEGQEARWSATAGVLVTATSKTSTVAASSDRPPFVLFVIVVHTDRAATLRAAISTSFEGALPNESVSSAWAGSGPAQLSYYVDFEGPLGRDSASHGLDVATTGPSSGLALTAGQLVLRSAHHDVGPALEFSSSLVLPQAGAARAEVVWEAAGGRNSSSLLVAMAGVMGQFAGHVARGTNVGATVAALSVEGASVLPQVAFSHSSVPLDLEKLGVREPLRFLPVGEDLPDAPVNLCSSSHTSWLLGVSC